MRALKVLLVAAVLMVSANVCEAWPRIVYPGYAYSTYYAAPTYYGNYYAPAYSTWRYPAVSPYAAYYGGYVAPYTSYYGGYAAPYRTYYGGYTAPGYYYGW